MIIHKQQQFRSCPFRLLQKKATHLRYNDSNSCWEVPRNWRYTGTETRQIFFSYVGNGKYFEELFTLTLNGIVVSGWYVSSALVVHHARLPDRLRRMQRNEPIRNEENQKRWLFPKWNINMTIQWQALSVHTLRSQLYMLQCINKKHPPTYYPAKKPKHKKLLLQT